MKKTLLLALGVAALFLTLVAVQQARQRATAQDRLVETQRLLAESNAEAERDRTRDERERARLQALNAQLADRARSASASSPGSSTHADPTDSTTPNERKRFNEVHKDPEMKEAMRRQARQVVGKTVKQLVTTNLTEQLHLSETQTAALKDLVSRKGRLGFEFMMPLMAGELDGTALAEAGRQMKEAMNKLDDEMKALLGPDGARMFDDNERAQPDRERADKLATMLNDAGRPMNAGQQQQLLMAMTEERNQFQFTTDYSDTTKIDFEHFKEYYAEDRMNTYFDEMTRLNERLVQRARTILSPEQADRFQDLLRDQTLKSKYVVKTTNALIGKQASK